MTETALPSFHVRTPLLESHPMSAALGARVLLKMEAFQPVGSFKIRGLGRACARAVADGAKRLVSSSGGNAGLAVAHAGRRLGVPVSVIVPRTTPEAMRAVIRAEGAEVTEHGASWDDAHARAGEVAGETDGALMHPFDDPIVWAGHAPLVEEMAEDLPSLVGAERPGAVVVSVGGGGLLVGILEGMHRVGWTSVPVIAVETDGAASYAASIAAGALVTLDAIESIATTLGARTVCAEALRWTERHPIESRLVSDRAAVDACERFAAEHRVLVEPSCGAALAAVHDPGESLAGRDPVIVIVCGGAGASPELLAGWRKRVGR